MFLSSQRRGALQPRSARRAIRPALWIAGIFLGSAAGAAVAQSSCSSDGTLVPPVLYERFLNADCEACWGSAPRHPPSPSALVLDWIAPGGRGDEAPLSAAAIPEALERLQQLGRPALQGSDTHVAELAPNAAGSRARGLRVAHGLPLNDYIGVSMSLRKTPSLPAGPYRYTLVLAETLPAGTEQSPVERSVVRGMLQGTWEVPANRSASAQPLQELRSMRLPEGAQAERLFVAAWVEDAAGRIALAARSQCGSSP
ncbi:hypothetical protein M4R22_08335 [Acidovorax sp. GBBC 3334]|uniref:hypothetical protein n=1 Tax=Acidovorax sp. GBBC 3334 TaxID=2940496 RepID=UPI0023025C3D|nr:hypothetical protein [Acidovorax sp. GBBC 3334]MDA8454769.1 hypothetical protein [Acidovorax sp. GBBC 3334]